MINQIASTILIPFAFIASLIFPTSQPNLGASQNASKAVAFYEDNLAGKITSSATSFTLVRGTDVAGTALASSTYGFVLDEGTASEELVLADCTSTACTNATRGISPVTGTTTVSALQQEHRKGASVKITDAPALIYVANIFQGSQFIENKLRYNSNLTFTNDAELISKKYVDDTAFSGAGVVDGSATARGVLELATQLETASSTAVGGSGNLAIPSSNATSTYNSATAPLRVVVTNNAGKIDDYFIATTTLFTNASLANVSSITITGTSNIASTTIYATTTTGTWTKPSNLRFLIVEAVGGGGGGGGNTDSYRGSGGGGGGGYCKKVIPTVALGSTETVTIGAAGAAGAGSGGNGGAGGNTSFGSHCTANGGAGGDSGGDLGAGGTATGGDINISGGSGGDGRGPSGGTTASIAIGGHGGNSMLGMGRGLNTSSVSSDGGNGGLYGGGGSGAAQENDGTDHPGGAGAAGVVILTYIFY